MIWSKFNHFFTKENHYFLYNSNSNSLLELESDSYDELLQISKSMNFDDDELKKMLLDYKIIVEDDELEIKRIIYKTRYKRFLKDKLILTICPTLSCNFNCPYCFEREHPTGNMTMEIEDKIITYIKKQNCAKSLSVTWFGGEPLLNFDSISRLSEKFLELPLNYSASIITNGYLLNSTIAAQLERLKINYVQITLYGPKTLHDSRRYLKNGKGTFDIITSNLKEAAKICKNITFAVRVNLDNSNNTKFTDLRQQILSWGIANIKISPSFVVDYSEEQNNCTIMSSIQQKDFLINMSLVKGIRYEKFYPSQNRFECAVRNMNAFVIGPDGELYKCWNDVGDVNRIYGTIDNKIVNENVMLEYLIGADPLEDNSCLDCFLFPRCGGGCPYHRLWENRHNTKQSVCPLHKNFLDELLWAHYKMKESRLNT